MTNYLGLINCLSGLKTVTLDKPKAEWDKTTKDKFNANNKAVNAIFCGVSLEEFHKISHVETTKKV